MPEVCPGETYKQDLKGRALQEKEQLEEVCRGHMHILTVHGFR